MLPAAVSAAALGKRLLKDRVVYTFPLAHLPNDARQSALVIVWHAPSISQIDYAAAATDSGAVPTIRDGGALVTYFVPDLGVLKENGEVSE